MVEKKKSIAMAIYFIPPHQCPYQPIPIKSTHEHKLTVCDPKSWGPVVQHPSRVNPVMGSVPQSCLCRVFECVYVV